MTQETLSYDVQKTRLRSAMAEQVVNKEEKENARKRLMNGDDCEEGSSRRTKASKGEEWKQFLDDQDNKKCFMRLSPEKHNLIWCGKLVRYCLPHVLAETSIAIFDAESETKMQPCCARRPNPHCRTKDDCRY
ncbi:hypothetical protein [Parasitella parasitica]|uniref:Uncharacterized protein n=1 Tax=Parasitella parasitica TaxID=35722 RepID=A0A0B7MYW6_9FUNG|nr:hypothetical protein [Parasitella parasitica]